jgi:hypothetical protein
MNNQCKANMQIKGKYGDVIGFIIKFVYRNHLLL